MHKITPEEMTRIVFGDYEEVFFEKSEADSWLREIGKRIGRKPSFRTYRFMNEKYQFIVGMFDEYGNVLVSDNRYKLQENEVVPAYMGFYTNTGTQWDVEINEAKMECLSYLKGRFYFDYTLELVEKESKVIERLFSHYMIADGKMFHPIPDAETIGGLVFKMDIMNYGRGES